MVTRFGVHSIFGRCSVSLLAAWMVGSSGVTAADEKPAPALKGYCPAAYLLLGKAVKGDSARPSTYGGELYYLSSPEAKKAFDADPEKYLPQFGGLDLVALGGPYGNRFESDPAVFEIHEGKVYLFALERSRQVYLSGDPSYFIENARKRFHDPQLHGRCPVSYQLVNKTVKGDSKFTVIYRRMVFHLADVRAKELFLKAPQKYLPQYDGLCAEGVSRNKRFPADGTVFSVVDGKTYFLWDAKAKEQFDANPREFIGKADANWATLGKQ